MTEAKLGYLILAFSAGVVVGAHDGHAKPDTYDRCVAQCERDKTSSPQTLKACLRACMRFY